MAEGIRIAVADLGTNSTRLLVAEVDDHGALQEIERRTEVTRLGEGVDATGRLSDEAMERVHACLAEYRRLSDELGVESSLAVATSAVRDADNGRELEQGVREQHGFDIRVIAGEEEARLTFLGATAGRAADGAVLVIDIGGGSTEYVVGCPASAPAFFVSTQLGSVRQTERHLCSDPPAGEEMEALAAAVREVVTTQVPDQVRADVAAGIAVAGTATSLAAIDQRLEPYDAARVDGYRLSLRSCERMLDRLAALPVTDRREVAGLHPDRAPTIVAGVAILIESMRAFGLAELQVSEADILHGAALDAATTAESARQNAPQWKSGQMY